MPRSQTGRAARVVMALAGAVWLSPAAQAVVETLDATVTAQVQEFVGAAPGDSDFAFEDLLETTGNLPLSADAELFLTADGQDQAGARAATRFFDPRVSSTPDPDEFSIDASTFSQSTDVSYDALSSATETREITFLAEEIGEPDGTELQARSEFFLDGMLLLWGERGHDDLTGTRVRIALSVQQRRPDETEPAVVLQAGLTLTGQSDGTVALSTTGALAAENITVMDLTDPAGEFGPLYLVIIPPTTALSYQYPARVGETFVLQAQIEGEARSQPGTGAAVQLGVPLLELALLINDVTGGQAGDLLQETIEAALGSSSPSARTVRGVGQGTTVTVVRRGFSLLPGEGGLPVCGSMGAESALLLTLFAATAMLSSRRGR